MIELLTFVSQATVPFIQSQQIVCYKHSQTMTKASNLSVPKPDTKTPQNQQVGDVQPRPWQLCHPGLGVLGYPKRKIIVSRVSLLNVHT